MNEPTRKAYEDLKANKLEQVKTRLRVCKGHERKEAIAALVNGETFSLGGSVEYKTDFVDYDLLAAMLEDWIRRQDE